MKVKYSGPEFEQSAISERGAEMAKWHELLMSPSTDHIGADFKGWAKLPSAIEKSLTEEIKQAAEDVRSMCSLLIVIGIGGSYLGAKAVIDALNGCKDDYPEVIFAGFNMNGAHLKKLQKRINKEDTCLCVISKSGKTVEPLLT